MMFLLLARTRTYHRDFMFFAVTSVTAGGDEVSSCCLLTALKEGG